MLEMYPDRKLLRRRVSQHGMDFIQKLLQLMEADTSSKGVRKDTEVARFRDIRNILQEIREENACLRLKDLAVNGRDLINLGFAPGPEIGACLEQLLSEVLDEQLPNQSDALLLRAKALLKG
jgi:tRNA nucleotidyltransferase (CCA-adding enzyme)